jgi:hypothetical protein
MKSFCQASIKATREPIRSMDWFRHFGNWQSDERFHFHLLFTMLAYVCWRLPGSLGQSCTLNSLLSVLVKETRHLILYTLESAGEALSEQPHLTGGSKMKPGGKTGSSHQSGNDRRRGSGLPVRSSGLQHSSGGECPKLQITPDCNQQFACQGNNTDLVQALAALAKATLVPAPEFAVGLVA